MQLNAIGLIEIRPRRGAVVIDPASAPHSTRCSRSWRSSRAWPGRSPPAASTTGPVAAITAAHRRCEQSAGAGDSDAYYYDNEEFHKAIYAASRSDFLEEQCLQLHRRLRPYRRLTAARAQPPLDVLLGTLRHRRRDLSPGTARRPAASCGLHVGIQGERFSDLVASMTTR